MSTTRTGPSHPLCLLATAVLLLNDHWWKAAWPGFLTGKLSDFAWLVVAPVVTAAALSYAVPERPARWASLSGIGGFFVALQLYAPLGETLVGWYGGSHVADAGDLIALPALLLAARCWRPARPIPLALPIAAFACVATSIEGCGPLRQPFRGQLDWDPHAPLLLGFGYDRVRHDTAGVMSRITVERADGTPVDLVAATHGNQIALCPIGGLEPDTDYVWTVEELGSTSANHLPAGSIQTGTWTFRTAASGSGAVAVDERGCRALVDGTDEHVCGGWDTGPFDTGGFDTGM